MFTILCVNVFINTVCSQITSCFLLFTDDIQIFYAISFPDDCIVLQNVLIRVAKCCNAVGLNLNTNKCKVMTYYRTGEFISFDYCLDSSSSYALLKLIIWVFSVSPHLIFDFTLILLLGNRFVYLVL